MQTIEENTQHMVSNKCFTQIHVQENRGKTYLPWHFRTKMVAFWTHFQDKHVFEFAYFQKYADACRGRPITRLAVLLHENLSTLDEQITIKTAKDLHLPKEIADPEQWKDPIQDFGETAVRLLHGCQRLLNWSMASLSSSDSHKGWPHMLTALHKLKSQTELLMVFSHGYSVSVLSLLLPYKLLYFKCPSFFISFSLTCSKRAIV